MLQGNVLQTCSGPVDAFWSRYNSCYNDIYCISIAFSASWPSAIDKSRQERGFLLDQHRDLLGAGQTQATNFSCVHAIKTTNYCD